MSLEPEAGDATPEAISYLHVDSTLNGVPALHAGC